MKALSDWDVFIAVLLALLVAHWWTSDDGKLTVYWLDSAGKAAARETFSADRASRTVSAYRQEVGGNSSFNSLSDCTIIDSRNWECVNGVVRVIDGDVVDSDRSVGFLHWWALRALNPLNFCLKTNARGWALNSDLTSRRGACTFVSPDGTRFQDASGRYDAGTGAKLE